MKRVQSWFNAQPHKWQMLIGLGGVAAVIAVALAGVIVKAAGHSESWRAGRDYERQYIAELQDRFGGTLSDEEIRSADVCESVYLLADSVAGGQAYADGEPAYDRDEWIAGCKSAIPRARSSRREPRAAAPPTTAPATTVVITTDSNDNTPTQHLASPLPSSRRPPPTRQPTDAAVLRSAKVWRACAYAWGNYSEPGTSPYVVAQERAQADVASGYKTHADVSWAPAVTDSVVTDITCYVRFYFPSSRSTVVYSLPVPRGSVNTLFGLSGNSNTFSHPYIVGEWELDSATTGGRPSWYAGNAIVYGEVQGLGSDAAIAAYLKAHGHAADDPAVFRDRP